MHESIILNYTSEDISRFVTLYFTIAGGHKNKYFSSNNKETLAGNMARNTAVQLGAEAIS